MTATADAVLAARPALPYRSHTVDGLSGVTVNGANGQVVVDGLAHTPAAALELSAAIARAARETKAQDSGTALFVKQLGSVWAQDTYVAGQPVARTDPKGGRIEYLPKALRIREYPTPRTAAVAS